MPRGVKKALDLDAQIQQVETKILELEEQRKSLMQKKKESSIQKLLEFLNNNNMSPAEAIESLSSVAAAAQEDPSAELV